MQSSLEFRIYFQGKQPFNCLMGCAKATPSTKLSKSLLMLPEIYMQNSGFCLCQQSSRRSRFKMNNKKHIIGLEQFQGHPFKICPKSRNNAVKKLIALMLVGSGADEGTGVTPGVPDAPDYDSDDDISWKSSDEDVQMRARS
ncbi:hypothetical protein Tco_1361748 [Tanacetum coccineum]